MGMSERGSLLIGLIMSGVILSFALVVVIYSFPRYSTDLNSAATDALTQNSDADGGTPADAIKQANKIKVQADLKSIQTSMMIYFAEQGSYPNSLEELISYMGSNDNTVGMKYLKCSDQGVAIYHNSSGYPGYIFDNDQITPTSGSAPTCS